MKDQEQSVKEEQNPSGDSIESPRPAQRHYVLTHRVHPDTMVCWFLATHHYWFDESLGHNTFCGLRDHAERYLMRWANTGTFPKPISLLESYVESKFEEWLNSSWRPWHQHWAAYLEACRDRGETPLPKEEWARRGSTKVPPLGQKDNVPERDAETTTVEESVLGFLPPE